jgi:hypothetical protein
MTTMTVVVESAPLNLAFVANKVATLNINNRFVTSVSDYYYSLKYQVRASCHLLVWEVECNLPCLLCSGSSFAV